MSQNGSLEMTEPATQKTSCQPDGKMRCLQCFIFPKYFEHAPMNKIMLAVKSSTLSPANHCRTPAMSHKSPADPAVLSEQDTPLHAAHTSASTATAHVRNTCHRPSTLPPQGPPSYVAHKPRKAIISTSHIHIAEQLRHTAIACKSWLRARAPLTPDCSQILTVKDLEHVGPRERGMCGMADRRAYVKAP